MDIQSTETESGPPSTAELLDGVLAVANEMKDLGDNTLGGALEMLGAIALEEHRARTALEDRVGRLRDEVARLTGRTVLDIDAWLSTGSPAIPNPALLRA